MKKTVWFQACPCVPACLWLIAGLILPVLPATAAAGWPLTTAAAAAIAATAWLATPRGLGQLALLLPAGALLAAVRLHPLSGDPVDRLAAAAHATAIEAVITEAAFSGDELDWLSGRRGYLGQLRSVTPEPDGEPRRERARILLQFPPAMTAPLEYGSRLTATGRFERPAPALVPGEFNYRRFLRSRSVKWIFVVEEWEVTAQVSGWRTGLRALYRARENLARRLTRYLDQPQPASLLLAMTLGYREGIDARVTRAFVHSGIVHIFAISGLHVGIVGAFLLGFLKLVWVPYRWRYLVLPLALGTYVLMTGAGPSAVRAWLMISLWAGAKAALLPLLPLNAVAAAAMVILLIRPLQIIDPGFQFSFVIVTVLITGWRAGAETVATLRETEFWIPHGSHTRSRLLYGRIVKLTAILGSGSLIAWLGSFALIIYTQGLFIPGALFLNAIVALVAWAALFLAILQLGFDLLLPWIPLAWLCGTVLNRLMALLQWLALTGSERPFSFTVVRPWFGLIFVYYGLLLATLTGLRGHLRGWHRLLPGLLAPLLLLTGSWLRQARQTPALAVFWGDRTAIPVLALDSGHRLPPVIVDTGDYRTGQRVAAWVRGRGWDEAEAVIITETAWEQSAGLAAFLEQAAPATLILPENYRRFRHLRIPAATVRKYGGRVREFPPDSDHLLRQPALTATLQRLNDTKQLTLTRRTIHGELPLLIHHDPRHGTHIRIEPRDNTEHQYHIPFSRNPQWRQIELRHQPIPPVKW